MDLRTCENDDDADLFSTSENVFLGNTGHNQVTGCFEPIDAKEVLRSFGDRNVETIERIPELLATKCSEIARIVFH